MTFADEAEALGMKIRDVVVHDINPELRAPEALQFMGLAIASLSQAQSFLKLAELTQNEWAKKNL
jgi:hypothetical protein